MARWVVRGPPQPYLRFDRNDYSLDPGLVGRRVEVRATRWRSQRWRSTRKRSPAAVSGHKRTRGAGGPPRRLAGRPLGGRPFTGVATGSIIAANPFPAVG
jgi:hypothetical protein